MATPHYERGKPFSKETKELVFKRERGICPLCNEPLDPRNDGYSNMGKKWNAHHIQAQSKGGMNSPDNCLIICSICHERLHKIIRAFPNADFKTHIKIFNEVVHIRQMMGAQNIYDAAHFDDALEYFKKHH